MTPTRAVLLLGAIIVIHALAYWFMIEFLDLAVGSPDAAGTIMLIGLGLAMGFGGYVLVRGARDL